MCPSYTAFLKFIKLTNTPLKGGLEYGKITELYGEAGVG